MIALPLALGLVALGPATPSGPSAPARAQEARRWTDEDLAPLAAGLASTLAARRAGRGLEEARAELEAALAVLRESGDGADPLAQPPDLARAVWLARGYADRKVKPGKVVEVEVTAGNFRHAPTSFTVRLPQAYDPEGPGHPLILALPDVDEDPAAHVRTHWSLPAIRDAAIVVCPVLPADGEAWTQVQVAGRPGGITHALTALREATEQFAVDFDRVFVAGRGASGPAAVAVANHSPQLFAGLVLRAGDVGDPAEAEEQDPDNLGNVPAFFAGAGANARAFAEAAEGLGSGHATLDPDGSEDDCWQWILAHRRDPAPRRAAVVVGVSYPSRVDWLRVASVASDSRATASADREANVVTVDGQGVSHATLYLNDALVDLDRPVTVVCNGVERVVQLERSVSALLDLLQDGTSDPGRVFVAEERFDLSGAEAAPDAGVVADPDLARLLAAADDADALWRLHERCLAADKPAGSRRALEKLLRIAPDHEQAHRALGHQRAQGMWFPDEAALARFLRRQEPAAAEARGHVQHDGVWMHPDERRLAGKGWTLDAATGTWLSAADRRRLEEGWGRQDLAWIPPGEVDALDAGQWRVSGEWCDLPAANRRRSRLDAMWVLPTPDVLLHTTVDRDVAVRAAAEMARAIPDLNRVFGLEPRLPLPVVLVRQEEQYDRFAFGAPDGSRGPAHAGRTHIVHSAFLAEGWFPVVDGETVHRAVGVGYWNALAPHGDAYGVHSARLAVGFSYADAVDPSPKAVRRALSRGPSATFHDDYFAEKRLPAWLRTGGAVYAERYFRDERVAEGGDPWWARGWSLDNLERLGGLRPLDEVFAFPLDPDDRDDGLKLMIEAGLLVAFVLDGDCAPVQEAHAKLTRALVADRVHANHVEGLEDALRANEAALRAFAAR